MEQSSFPERLRKIKSGPKELRRIRLQAFREDMRDLDERLTALIDDLWIQSRADPPPNADELRDFLKERALPSTVEEKALEAVEQYRVRQERIERIVQEYPDPKGLFEACFGVSPNGEVQLIRSAICLNFVLLDDRDYIAAYAHHGEKDSRVLLKKQQRALESDGCALSSTRLQDSDHLFTLVRVGANKEQRRTERIVEERRIIPPGGCYFTKGITQLEFEYQGKKATIIYHRSKGNHFVQGARATTDSPLGYANVFDETTDTKLRMDDLEVRIGEGDESDQIVVTTDVVSSFSQLRNLSPDPVKARISQFAEEVRIVNPVLIERILLHEGQHQWNSLFQPEDPTPPPLKERLEEIVNDPRLSAKEGFIAALDLMFDRTRRDTRLGVIYQRAEIRGRDEILAYYRDGSDVNTIGQHLQTNLYNYFDTDDQEKLRNEIASFIKKYQHLFHSHHPEETLFSFSDDDGEAYIHALKARYEACIAQGLRAIALLEKASLSRERIVAKLYRANLPEWISIARRYVKDHS